VLLLIAPASGILSIIAAILLFYYVDRQATGTEKMVEIADAIKEGSRAFLKRQYQTLGIFTISMSIVIAILLGLNIAITYIMGSICSALAGFIGMEIAVRANVRTAYAAEKGIKKAFPIAFYAGAVMGLLVVGFALLGISLLYFIYSDPQIILGFSFGASTIALFAKAGGGIYTKTADISADLVGKVEMNIPEDDPRNPAVIADNVGDNVGDVAGTGADLFDSYVGSIVATMILGLETLGAVGITLPLIVAGTGIIASILGTLAVRVGEKESAGAALNRGTFLTTIIFGVLTYVLFWFMDVNLNFYYAIIVGLIAGVGIGLTSDYFTSIDRGPVKITAEASKTGTATNILTGFSYGLVSVVPPIIGISIATLISWVVGGVYGVALAALGMLSITGMVVSSDSYGPIVDNAAGIAEQSGMREEVIEITSELDAAGNTAKAITKGFAIGAAALTVLALFTAYSEIVDIRILDLMNPIVLVGVFIGSFMPPLFSALTILSVGKNAFRMIEEIRRQFKDVPGLIEGKARPDYARCVDIATKGALKELVLPSILSITMPLMVGFIFGREALGGFLAGSIITGVLFALFMANSGGTWDNAKKYIEAGHFGGKGSEAHKAAVVGDTVGDPFKDTAGPSLNTMITVMSLTASVFAPVIIAYSLFV